VLRPSVTPSTGFGFQFNRLTRRRHCRAGIAVNHCAQGHRLYVTDNDAVTENGAITDHDTVTQYRPVANHDAITQHDAATEDRAVAEDNSGAGENAVAKHDAVTEDDAIAENKRALEIEPQSLIISSLMGRVFYQARQYDRAVSELGKSLELGPDFAQAHLYLGWAYEQQGKYEDAIAELQKGLTLSGGESEMAGALGHAYAMAGKRGEAAKALAELKERSTQHYVAPFDIALIYAGLGATNLMFEWLEKAYEDHSFWLVWIKTDPRFDSIRDDPRYRDLLRRMRLPE